MNDKRDVIARWVPTARDWASDFVGENGNYMNGCGVCGKTFRGHKGRCICRLCARPKGGEAVSDERTVIEDVMVERHAQDNKWGVQDHGWSWWLAILMEEVGEASKAAVDDQFYIPHKEPSQIGSNKEYREHLRANLRQELVQIAAVAVAMVECGDRNDRWTCGEAKGGER